MLELMLSVDEGTRLPPRVVASPLVTGARWNTGAPVARPRSEVLADFRTAVAPAVPWVDLKCRELRIVQETTVPAEPLVLNHPISVKTPTTLYYNEGRKFLVVEELVGERELFIKPPRNAPADATIRFGGGASVNIPDPSLEIHGYLTDNDRAYVQAARTLGIHNFLLSFVESAEDIGALKRLDPAARVVAKIENPAGLEYVRNAYHPDHARLLAARADLYIELTRPHEILRALGSIIRHDPRAIAGSRLLESFLDVDAIPTCADLCDVGYLHELGYRHFLLGDDICARPPVLSSVIGVFDALNHEFTTAEGR